MRRWLLVLLVALLGCPQPRVDDDDAIDDDDSSVEPCDRVPGPSFYVCPENDGFPWATQLTGTFGAVAADGLVSFTTTGGDVYPLRFAASAVPGLPDLASAGQLLLRMDGGCDPKGGAYNQLLVRRDADPPLVVLFGSNLQAAGGAGFLVEAPRDLATCPGVDADWCFCWQTCHPKPVTFTLGGDSWTLYQGQSLDVDDAVLEVGEVRLEVFEAYSGDGKDCADVGTDTQGWSIVGREWL